MEVRLIVGGVSKKFWYRDGVDDTDLIEFGLGPIGVTGATGIQGPTGSPGVTGATGIQGPIGNQGAPGETLSPKGVILDYVTLIGLTGMSLLDTYILQSTAELYVYDPTAGIPPADSYGWVNMGAIQGPPGATGIQGPAGTIGPEGPAGVTGAIGAVGPTGATGIQGPIGNQGVPGETLSPKGVILDYTTLIGLTGMSSLDTYILQSTAELYVYDPTAGIPPADSYGWVNMGAIQGPPGATGIQGPTGTIGPEGPAGVTGATGSYNVFFNIGTTISATNSTSSIYRTGSINIGSGTATHGGGGTIPDSRFVVSSSGGTVSLVVDDSGNVYNGTPFSQNTAFGYGALLRGTSSTGGQNTAIGNAALTSNTTGTQNTAVGLTSLRSNTSGGSNTAIGHNALFSNTTAGQNVALGFQSMYSNTTGFFNTALGYRALLSGTNSSYNTAVGYHSLSRGLFASSAFSGNFNTAVGFYSLLNNISGNSNTAIGERSLVSNTTGNLNTAIGSTSLLQNTTGNFNIALGASAGNVTISGSFATNSNNSLFIGYDTRPQLNNQTNQIVIGHGATGNGSNSVTLGNDSILSTILKGNVGIGLTGPSTKLHIYATQSGAFRLEDGTQGPGKILVSDATGVGTWTASVTGPQGSTGATGIGYVLSTSASHTLLITNQAFTPSTPSTSSAFIAGNRVRVIADVDANIWMEGNITLFSVLTLIVNVDTISGTVGNTYTGWKFTLVGNKGATGATGFGVTSSFYLQGTTDYSYDTTSAIYRTGSLNIGTGSVSNSRFVVSSSNGTTSLVVDEIGNIYNGDTNYNTKFGYQALYNSYQSYELFNSYNTVIGYQAAYKTGLLPQDFVARLNTVVGYQSLYDNIDGEFNVAIGAWSLFKTTTSGNSAIGYRSLYNNTNGASNTAVGSQTLEQNIGGQNNTVVGYQSFQSNTTGGFNVAIGAGSGVVSVNNSPNINSNSSIFIGYNSKSFNTSSTNEIVIGATAIGNGSNSVTLGNDNITKTILKGNIGIGTASASTKLHVYGTQSGAFRLEDGTQGPGYVLISDANGVGTWASGSFVGLTGSNFTQGEKTFGGNSNKIVIDSGNYQGVFAGVSGGGSGTNFYSQNQGTGIGAYFDTFSTGRAVYIVAGTSSSGRVLDIAAGGSGDAISISSSGTGRLIVGMSGSNVNFTLNKAGEIYSTKIGIGLTGPSTKLHVYATQSGAFRLEDGTQGPGYVLTSDVNGVASWTSSLTGLSLLGNSEVISASVSATASLVVYDYSSSSIFYHATASTNFTANFTNLPTTNNRVLSATIVISQGSTAYIPNIVQIAGVTQSIKWAGGTQSGTANSLDLISFNFIRTGNTWTNVIGQIAPFS